MQRIKRCAVRSSYMIMATSVDFTYSLVAHFRCDDYVRCILWEAIGQCKQRGGVEAH